MAINLVKHYVVPSVAIIGGPILTHYLANYASPEGLDGFHWKMLTGNGLSWLIVVSWIVWCSSFLIIPFDKYKGLANVFGYSPDYTCRCLELLGSTILIYLSFHSMWPRISIDLYHNFPYLVGSLNIFGFAVSLYLWYQGQNPPQQVPPILTASPSTAATESLKRAAKAEAELPAIYKFYRGTELHPTIINFDVKQWAMRIGTMGWGVLILIFYIGAYHEEGFSTPLTVNVILQAFYLYKFTEWETSYLTTKDMTQGHAGFYLCWGSVALVPCLHTYSTYYMITHLPKISYLRSVLTLIMGVMLIVVRYQVEYQKDQFKETNGECTIWGRQVTFVEAEYQTANGKKKYRLLTSGFWGMARHINYLFDVLTALVWCSPGFGTDSLHPYLYPIFLVLMYLQRAYQNDNRCFTKYGKDWEKYCKIAKYKMIPYIF